MFSEVNISAPPAPAVVHKALLDIFDMISACKKSVTVCEDDLIFADIVDISDVGEGAFVKTGKKQVRQLGFELRQGTLCKVVPVFCMYQELMGKDLDIKYIIGRYLFILAAVGGYDIPRIAVILPYGVVELFHIDRVRLIFQDIPEGSYRIALTGEFLIACQEYDNNLFVYFSDKFSGLESVQSGHFDIEDYNSVLILAEIRKQFSACFEFVEREFVVIRLKGRKVLFYFC